MQVSGIQWALGLVVLPLAMFVQQTPREERRENRQAEGKRVIRDAKKVVRDGVEVVRDGVDAVRDAVKGEDGAYAGTGDQILAKCLWMDNQAHVDLAKMVVDRTESPEVKQYAEMMIKEHGAILEKLEPFANAQVAITREETTETTIREDREATREANRAAREANADRDDTADRDVNDRAAADRDATVEARSETPEALAAHGGINFLEIKKEIGEECGQSFTTELNSKQGADYDMLYLGQQYLAHMHMLATLKVFERHATSPEFKEVLTAGTETVQSHFEHTKSLCDQLHNADRTARREKAAVGANN